MRKALSLIREGAVKANKIVSDLLTFARQAPPDLKPQDLRETVQAAVRLTTYLTRQAQVRMNAELPEQAVITVYDTQQIEQVFINLITNAVQATQEHGTLWIRLSQDDLMRRLPLRIPAAASLQNICTASLIPSLPPSRMGRAPVWVFRLATGSSPRMVGGSR